MSDARLFVLPVVVAFSALIFTDVEYVRTTAFASPVAGEGLALRPDENDALALPRTSRLRRTAPPRYLLDRELTLNASDLSGIEEDFSPAQWCAALSTIGGSAPEFKETREDWECSALLTSGDQQEPNVLFIQITGQGERIDRFRAKLNILGRSDSKDLQTTLAELLKQLPLMLSNVTQEYLAAHVDALRPLTSTLEGLDITLQPEAADPRRHNLIIVRRNDLQDCDEGLPPSSSRRILPYSVSCLPLPSADEIRGRSY